MQWEKQTTMKLGSAGENKRDMKGRKWGMDLIKTCHIHVQNYQIKNKGYF